MLGDAKGPCATAIAVGPYAVLSAAHALTKYDDPDNKNTKKKKNQKNLVYNEEYWVQPNIECKTDGYSEEGRVHLELYKFHEENDWALFRRIDGKVFPEFADIYQLTDAENVVGQSMTIHHCPVALLSQFGGARQYNLACNVQLGMFQSQSSHHAYYSVGKLYRGSSGGAIYVNGDSLLLGMHLETWTDVEYDPEESDENVYIKDTPKRVSSEDYPYDVRTLKPDPDQVVSTNKKRKSDSEGVASVVSCMSGQGCAIIICKYKRLMHCIDELKTVVQRSGSSSDTS